MNIILFEHLNKDINKISLDDFRAKHIINVLKLKKGDFFKSGIINSSQGISEILKIDDNFLYFDFLENLLKEEDKTEINIILGAVRPICFNRMLKTASEVLVKNIFVYSSDLSEKSYLDADIYKYKWKEIALNSAMQSGKTNLLNLEVFYSLEKAIERVSIIENRYVLDIGDFEKLSNNDKKNVVIAIGSERGHTQREREIFKKSDFQFRSITKSSILRTETAFNFSLYPFI